MIKVQLKDLLKANDTLEKIGNTQLKGSLAYKIGKGLASIVDELKIYDAARQKLLTECCEKDDNGQIKIKDDGTVQVLPDKISYYNSEIEKLNNIETELNLPELTEQDLSEISLTPKQILDIIWWIK